MKISSRFYEPTAGHILIDGRDIADVTLESLRRNIPPVLQDTFLFNGTIAENIGYPCTMAGTFWGPLTTLMVFMVQFLPFLFYTLTM